MNLKLVITIGRMKTKVCRWRMPVGAAVAASVVESRVGWGEVRSASGSGVGDPASARSTPRGPRLSTTNNTPAPMTTVLSNTVGISLLHKCYRYCLHYIYHPNIFVIHHYLVIITNFISH